MVFSSNVPVYLDPPNWQQQPNHEQQQGTSSTGTVCDHNNQGQLPPTGGGSGGAAGSIRPGSMADRARLAKIPQPEAALKCPRCDSTNTKFCYFNNYSLTQPRHFCKTCRRYWTRGGALRNVPVGGGCRRNKRTKGSSRSKSPAAATADRQTSTTPTNAAADILGHHLPPHPHAPPHLPFLPNLHHLADYGGSGSGIVGVDVGLNFGGLPQQVANTGGGDVEFQIGGGGGGLVEQWRLQQQVHQFPFLANLEPPTGLYPFDHAAAGENNVGAPSYICGSAGLLRSKALDSGVNTQLASVKMEGNHRHHQAGLNNNSNSNNNNNNLSRNFLGGLGINDHHHYLGGGGNAWTDLATFTSPTNHLL